MTTAQLTALLAPYRAGQTVCVMRYTRVTYLDRAVRRYGK